VFTVGDDIAWLRIGPDGGLWAVNPEAGYFGVAPGTSARSNPNAMKMIERDTIFTNIATTPDGDVWWEGMDCEPPDGTLEWRGRPWQRDSGESGAHPNSRFTAPMSNNPVLSPRAEHPLGVPISAIIFGGRRASTVPLIVESYDWAHGVFFGASMGSETTAAATGQVGIVRRDPMAMLPFCGYNIVNYFGHWHEVGRKMKRPPKIFVVNRFRKDRDGSYLWPGYGENIRALKWIADRVNGRVGAGDTPIGLVPREGDIDVSGLDVSPERLRKAMSIDAGEWLAELDGVEEYFTRLGVDFLTGFDVQIESARAALEKGR
jgi:phosphoenolpyruvate carboxykinase (GTP)